MDIALALFSLLLLSLVALGVVATVRTARAVRRGVERTGLQARRRVEETTLKARKYTQPGPAGDLAGLRLALRTSITGTREALEPRVASDASLGEALGLFTRLREHAEELDAELRLLEREPDRSRIAARLPELRERAHRITHSSDSLRWAAQDRARRFADDDLAALGRQIEVEAGALRHWAPAAPPEDELPGRPAEKLGRPLGRPEGTA